MGAVVGTDYVSAYTGDQIDAALGKAASYPAASAGTIGQVPTKTENGIEWATPSGGVSSFNGRTGAVVPATGDYTAAMVGAVAGLSSNLTLYVATTGNDSNSGLDSSHPLATINAAIAKIPQDLGGYSAVINIANGEYTELIELQNRYNGAIYIQESTLNGVTLNGGFYCRYCGCNVFFKIGTIKYSASVTYPTIALVFCAQNYVRNYIRISQIDGTGSSGYYGIYGSNTNVTIGESYNAALAIKNLSHAIDIAEAATAFIVNNLDTSSNNSNLIVANGGRIIVQAPYPSSGATTISSATNGGRIYAGAQTSIPNY